MQKIKYPVGSKLKNYFGNIAEVEEVTQNQKLCLLSFENEGYKWLSQKDLEFQMFKLVSTPRWRPEVGEKYFVICDNGKIIDGIWQEDYSKSFAFKLGLVFKTKEECQKKIDEINSREI